MMALDGAPDSLFETIERNGFVMTGVNHQIEVELDGESYYVDVHHSRDYVRRTWGQYFEILDIIDAVAANQDLVVMRRR
jgi:hypothetical protein